MCWKIETTCNNEDIEEENGYSKKISWIEKENYLCPKIEFEDLDGELHKIQSNKEYTKQSSSKYFAFYMEKENVQNVRKSALLINRFQKNSTLPESAFTPAMLEK